MRRPPFSALLTLAAGVVLAVLGLVGPFAVGQGSGAGRPFSPYGGNTLLGGAVVLLAAAAAFGWNARRRGARRLRVRTVQELVAALGVALLVAGVFVASWAVGVEAAYFVRSVGDPAYDEGLSVTYETADALSPYDANTFFGASGALILLVAAWIVRDHLRRAPGGDGRASA